MTAPPRPAPELTGLVGEFHERLATGTLHLQRCEACDRWWYPARLACASSPVHELAWRPVTGTGSIFSWTVTHQALHPAFADDVPYATALVELDEGPRLLGRLHGTTGDAVRVGRRVRLQVDDRDGLAVVSFVADDR